LTSLCNALNVQYDVVIDDGNHQIVSQVMSLFYLWPHIKKGGVYVVEDVQDEKLLERFKLFPNAEIHDLRGVKGRGDDLIAVIYKK
ncbi:MAG: hypothetical protein ACREGR_01725, partial [Minisyncoccia bacterium]